MAQKVPRLRERSSVQPTYVRIVTTQDGQPKSERFWAGAVNAEGSRDKISDYVTPGFRNLSKHGYITVSDLSLTKWTRSVSPGSLDLYIPSLGNYREEYYGDFATILCSLADPISFSIESDTGTMADVALVKALAKVNKSVIDGGTNFLELGQTLRMLRRPFTSAQDLLIKMHKRRSRKKWKSACDAAKATADSWLEYRYGWKPIIMDTNSIQKVYSQKAKKLDRSFLVARASESGSRVQTRSFQGVPFHGLPHWKGGGTLTLSETAKVGAGVYYGLTGLAPTAAEIYGTRARDIPQSLWETIPYSFVVDWFTNIGDWLQAITPAPGVTIHGNWTTVVYKRTSNFSGSMLQCNAGPANELFTGSPGGATETWNTVTRTVNRPTPNLPSFTGLGLSRTHQLDALALLHNPIMDLLKGMKH